MTRLRQMYEPQPRVLRNGRKLRAISNPTTWVRRAATGCLERRKSKWYSPRRTRRKVPSERVLGAVKLALEQTRELAVLWSLLAIWDLERVGRVAGLLNEYLGELDHVCIVVQRVGEVNHLVPSVLLVARTGRGQEGRKGGLGERVALLTTSGGKLEEKQIGLSIMCIQVSED